MRSYCIYLPHMILDFIDVVQRSMDIYKSVSCILNILDFFKIVCDFINCRKVLINIFNVIKMFIDLLHYWI